MKTISGTPIPELLNKPIDKEEIFEISHNFLMRNGLPFKEIIVPLQAISNSDKFLFDECPIVVKFADKKVGYIINKFYIYVYDDILANSIARIYKEVVVREGKKYSIPMTVQTYTKIWAERLNLAEEKVSQRFIHLTLMELGYDRK